MKVYNDTTHMELTKELQNHIQRIRDKKNFIPLEYIKAKADYLNKYMTKCGLDTCVVAVSGGIDSAVVLSLVSYASNLKDTPIKEIIAVTLPALNNIGVTNQSEADTRATELCNKLKLNIHSIDVNETVQTIRKNIETNTGYETDAWAIGQLVPYTRTPYLYYITSLCTVRGRKAILVGTTNRDEGAYLGYVGKASDGMVDVQLISDIHKSEVYRVAKELGVPDSITGVTPAGDMYDNRCDTEVFGAPYDFVELYLHWLRMSEAEKHELYSSLSIVSAEQFITLAKNLENLHRYNKHKYIAHSPAVHLDLWDCSCPDGWINYYEITRRFMEETNQHEDLENRLREYGVHHKE